MSSKEVKPKSKARTPYRQYKKAPVKRAPMRNMTNTYKPRVNNMTYSQASKYYNPFDKGNNPIYSTTSMGNFNCMNNVGNLELTVGSASQIIVFNPSVRGVFQVVGYNGLTGASNNDAPLASPTYRYASEDTTPVSYRPMRSGFKILNTTKNDNIGGSVDVISLSTNIEWEFVTGASRDITTANLTEILDLKNSNKCCTYSGSHFQNEITGTVFPATYSAYNSYGNRAFDSLTSNAAYQSSLQQTTGDMPMNLVVMIFNGVTVSNTYNIKFCTQSAMRFPSASLFNQMSITNKQPLDKDFEEKLNKAVASSNGVHKLTQGEPGVYYG